MKFFLLVMSHFYVIFLLNWWKKSTFEDPYHVIKHALATDATDATKALPPKSVGTLKNEVSDAFKRFIYGIFFTFIIFLFRMQTNSEGGKMEDYKYKCNLSIIQIVHAIIMWQR